MRVLVTGATGFVGRHMTAELLRGGHEVLAGVRFGEGADTLGTLVPMELLDPESLRSAVSLRPDAIIHLAAQASGAEARRDPASTYSANVAGTAALVAALEAAGLRIPFIFASTGEVYGAGHSRPIPESAPIRPVAPYAASKAEAEKVLMDAGARWGLPVVLARCFAQAGPGQREGFVIPDWSRRLLTAARDGRAEIAVGNLSPIREFVDVRDVARALSLLLTKAAPGMAYNVASGRGVALADVFEGIRREVGTTARAFPDPALFRDADIDYLVGEGERLARLGWSPAYSLSETLRDVVSELRAAASTT